MGYYTIQCVRVPIPPEQGVEESNLQSVSCLIMALVVLEAFGVSYKAVDWTLCPLLSIDVFEVFNFLSY